MKINKALTLLTAIILGTGLVAVQAGEGHAHKKQTTCPVMGGKINNAQYADVNGKRIYVCCAGCIGKIKADPAKYISQLEAQGVQLDKATTKSDTSKKKCSGHKH